MQGETAERILQAASALLTDRGYSAFSYADIADAVKIRKASIHHHFPTKAELVVAVLKRHRAGLSEAMHALDENVPNPLTRLQDYFTYWEGCIVDRKLSFCMAALLGAEAPSLPEEVQSAVRAHFALLTDWFEQTLAAGARAQTLQLRETVPTEAQMLIAVLHGGMLSARATGACDVFRQLSQAAFHRLSPA